MDNNSVTIELSKDESLVLFEWLSKQSNADCPIEIDAVEQYALDRLLGRFEKKLAEPFNPNYIKILEDARKNLSVKSGS
jgi:hypothetical protein